MDFDRYTLAVISPEDWNTIHNALIVDSNEDGIPDRKVTCTDCKSHSPTRGTYDLTEEEANEIAKHPKVKWIELSPSDYPDAYPKPDPATKRFKKDVKIYRDISAGGPNVPPGITTVGELDRTNWAVKRVGIATNGDSWPNVTGNPAPIFADVSYSLTGKNVDVVIQDSGILQYHPEFIQGNGESRVRDIVLDGPYYIDPDYFTSNNHTYTKPDGRTGITTASAHAWWENSSNRSGSFSSVATVSIDSGYTVARSVGAGGSAHSFTSGHGTGCAGLAAGKNFGLAFEANLWNINIFGDIMAVETSYDVLKIFHQNKPNIRVGTKLRKNPTVVNGSWGYQARFNTNTTVSYKFRGETGTFTGNDEIGTGTGQLARAMKEGLNNQVIGAYKSWSTSSGSNSSDTAGGEMIDAGVIFVAAAGNNNQRLGIGAADPDRLNYMTSTVGSDPRAEFPSGTKPCGHRDWMNPQGIGFNSTTDYHPVICCGAMEEYIGVIGGAATYEEGQAGYSNNGPGIDIWAPADETLSAGIWDTDETNYVRRDDANFADRFFNGTSAAAPVVTGLVALFLETNPSATSTDVKNFLKNDGSKLLPNSEWVDLYTNDITTDYWSGSYNNRGAANRVAFDPFASDTIPKFTGVTLSGISIQQS